MVGPQGRVSSEADAGFNRITCDTCGRLVVLVLTKNQDGQSNASLLR